MPAVQRVALTDRGSLAGTVDAGELGVGIARRGVLDSAQSSGLAIWL